MRIKSKIDLNLLKKGLHHLHVERLCDLDGSYKSTESLAGLLCEHVGIGCSAVNRRKVILVSRKLLGNILKPIQYREPLIRDRRKCPRPRRYNSDEYILPLKKNRPCLSQKRIDFISPFERTYKIKENNPIQYDLEYIDSSMVGTYDTQAVMDRKDNLENLLYAADADHCQISYAIDAMVKSRDDASQSFVEDNTKDGFRNNTSNDMQMDTFVSDRSIFTNDERRRLDCTSSAEFSLEETNSKDDIKLYHGLCKNIETQIITDKEAALTEKMKFEESSADYCKSSSKGDEMFTSNDYVLQEVVQDRETRKDEDEMSLLNDSSDNITVENFDVSCSHDIIEESNCFSKSENIEDDMSSSDGKEIMEKKDNVSKPYRKIESPESFQVCLSKDEWTQIKPNKYESQRKLRGNWTDLLTQKVSEKVPSCVLRFTYNRVKKKGTRKRNARYFYGKANCQFENCAQFIFEIQKKPKHLSKNGVQIKVTRKGEVRHKEFEERRRQLRGKRREEYKQEIERSGASKLHYEILGRMDKTAFDAGNRTDASTKQVLRNLQYERNKEHNLDDDDWKDLVLTKTVLDECDKESSHVRGYVQFLSISPFTVILFTEKQLKLLRNKVKTDESVLYLDATGSVVRKLKDSNKEIFYYAAVLKGNKSKEPPIPIAEMITNEHTTTMISLFLARVKQALLTLYRTWTVVQPARIELDYSWAMINAVLLICNQENITRYLNRAWEIANKSTSLAKYTKVHLCSAHLIKRVRDRLSKVIADKGLTEYCTFSFALLQNSYTLSQAADIYSSICIVLGSKSVTNTVQESVEKIHRRIALLPHADEVSSIHTPELETNVEIETGGTIRASSPFQKYFEVIRSQSNEMTKQCTETACRSNPYHNDKALDVIESYLHIYPLWSGLLLKQESSAQECTRDTNCFVEYWFRIVKYDILKKKLRQRAGRFIRMLHLNIMGRCREHEYSMKSTMRQRRVKEIEIETPTVKQDDIDVSKEQWRREAKTSQTKPRYFSPPKKFPTPKKGNVKDVKITKRPSNIMAQGENTIKKSGITTLYPALSDSKENFVKKSLIVRSDRVDQPGHGLENKHNNCWLNSLIQAMKNCEGLLHSPTSTFPAFKGGQIDPVLDILQKKMHLLLAETDEKVVHSVDDILDVIQAVPEYRDIEVDEQQDPSVLLHDRLARLHDVKSFEPSTLRYDHQCITCGEKRKLSEEKAYMFMVEMNLHETTVQKCLDEFFKEEVLTGSDAVYCQRCGTKTTHIRRTVLVQEADVLIILLKRFNASLSKLQTKIMINRTIIVDSEKEQSVPWALKSVQMHHGRSVNSGHYTTACISKSGIIHYDDATLNIKREDFLQSTFVQTSSYILYFERTVDYVDTSENDPIITVGKVLLYESDLKTLEGKNWINDQVINAFLAIIKRDSEGKALCIDSFYLYKTEMELPDGTNHKEHVFIPINTPGHWSLVVLFPMQKRISFLDPAGGYNLGIINRLRRSYQKKFGVQLTYDKKLDLTKSHQENGYDCGVFIMMYAEEITKGHPLISAKKQVSGRGSDPQSATLYQHLQRLYLQQQIQCPSSPSFQRESPPLKSSVLSPQRSDSPPQAYLFQSFVQSHQRNSPPPNFQNLQMIKEDSLDHAEGLQSGTGSTEENEEEMMQTQDSVNTSSGSTSELKSPKTRKRQFSGKPQISITDTQGHVTDVTFDGESEVESVEHSEEMQCLPTTTVGTFQVPSTIVASFTKMPQYNFSYSSYRCNDNSDFANIHSTYSVPLESVQHGMNPAVTNMGWNNPSLAMPMYYKNIPRHLPLTSGLQYQRTFMSANPSQFVLNLQQNFKPVQEYCDNGIMGLYNNQIWSSVNNHNNSDLQNEARNANCESELRTKLNGSPVNVQNLSDTSGTSSLINVCSQKAVTEILHEIKRILECYGPEIAYRCSDNLFQLENSDVQMEVEVMEGIDSN